MINRLSFRVHPRPKISSCRCRCNPLETLRAVGDPTQRARLLSTLDGKWSEYTDVYQPSPVEEILSNELGVDSHSVMTLAVGHGAKSNPPLCMYDTVTTMSSIKALKGANVDVADIWFLVSKNPSLLTLGEALQRWLDFLTVYGVRDKGRERKSFKQYLIHQFLQVAFILNWRSCKGSPHAGDVALSPPCRPRQFLAPGAPIFT